ncbi:hypothetical protein BRADI_2g31430v3 [Brachypodium distachyon]|uniref:Reverse transcriptase zinc-binding domain-containing protein n=1 Tax=Brachypodium distachyon TaxID=15368 RepID=A0A2K2DBB5_BRADI|nr:hypothetical protein BRADI_2g31430v3 [Brachypodium distachyon]
MLHQRNLHLPDYSCVLCNGVHLETRDHLFFHCQFSIACWRYICPTFTPQLNVHRNIMELKRHLDVPFHMEIIALVCWSIWRTRNDCIFNNLRPSLYQCRHIFKGELNLVFHRAKRKTYSNFKVWIDRFR